MNAPSPDPDLPEIIEPDRIEQLFDSATEILDLAEASQDPCIRRHLDAIPLIDELLFRAEAMVEAAEQSGNSRLAADERRQVHAARQLKAERLDTIDRHLDGIIHAWPSQPL